MRKQYLIIFACIIAAYFIVTFAALKISKGIAAPDDGYWYLKLAENIAKGNGLVENVAVYFYPKNTKLTEFPHPVGNYWNPLDSIIVAGFYKVFGISDFSSRLGGVLFDAFMCGAIFLLCLKLYPKQYWIAIFSSIVFILHPAILSSRVSSGIPENYDMLLVSTGCYFLYKAMVSHSFYFILSGFMSALAYLSRNEGGGLLIVIVTVFVYMKIKVKPELKWNAIILAILAFLITILPWEYFKYTQYGFHANELRSKVPFLLEYNDLWSYGKEFNLSTFLANGIGTILIRKISSFWYKAKVFFELLTWPMTLFFLFGIIANLKNLIYLPMFLYTLITYIIVGLLFSSGQDSGWHACTTSLAFSIPLCVSGVFAFFSNIIPKEKLSKKISILMCFLIVFYYAGSFMKFKKDNNMISGDIIRESSVALLDWFQKNKLTDKVIMIQTPNTFHYYSNLKMVQIPKNDTLESVKNAIKHFKCEYLVLTGYEPAVFAPLYNDEPGFTEFVKMQEISFKERLPVSGASNKLKIYKIMSN